MDGGDDARPSGISSAPWKTTVLECVHSLLHTLCFSGTWGHALAKRALVIFGFEFPFCNCLSLSVGLSFFYLFLSLLRLSLCPLYTLIVHFLSLSLSLSVRPSLAPLCVRLGVQALKSTGSDKRLFVRGLDCCCPLEHRVSIFRI